MKSSSARPRRPRRGRGPAAAQPPPRLAVSLAASRAPVDPGPASPRPDRRTGVSGHRQPPSPVDARRARSPRRTARAQEASSARRRQAAATGDPDVLLDVPNLSVEEINLEVQNLRAHVSLDARLANLLQLTAGRRRGDRQRQAHHQGRARGGAPEGPARQRRRHHRPHADDHRPQPADSRTPLPRWTTRSAPSAASPTRRSNRAAWLTTRSGRSARSRTTCSQPGGLLSQTVNTARPDRPADGRPHGNIVERTLDTAGRVVNQRTVGNVLDQPRNTVLGETTNAAGQTVRRVLDTSGAVIELTLDTAGKVINSRVVSGATGGTR